MDRYNSKEIGSPRDVDRYASLLKHIEAAFHSFKFSTRFRTVDEIIKNDTNSAEFIREVLHDEDYQTLEPTDEMYQFAKSRAVHSVLTFFVGLAFMEFGDFTNIIAKSVLNTNDPKDVVRLWMLTSLYHDWGYYSEYLKKSELRFNHFTKYNLLTDDYGEEDWVSSIQDFSLKYPHVLAYTYDEIKAYDRYARLYHSGRLNDTEKIDHGILGGMLIFNRLAKNISKDSSSLRSKRLLFAKIACLTIAQHNIYKSSTPTSDIIYGEDLVKLHSTSSFRISNDTPLLLLLSLVDTFECIKRFGQGENERFLQKRTILNNIFLSVSPERVFVDYSALEKTINNKKSKNPEQIIALKECFIQYKDAICNISNWTMLMTKKEGNNIIIIRLST